MDLRKKENLKLNIVQIISTLNVGGAENFCVQLVNELAKKNSVSLIILNPTNKNQSFINSIAQNVIVYELNWQKKYSPKQLLHLLQKIKKIKPTVIHVHLHNPFYYVYLLSFFYRKVNYFHTIHSSFKVWQPILKIINTFRFLNNKVTHICISKIIHQNFAHAYPKLKNALINNGILPYKQVRSDEQINDSLEKQLHIKKTEPFFLAIGNISFYKNYSLIAKSFKTLINKYPDIKCVIIGRDDDKLESNKITSINYKNIILAKGQINAADFLIKAEALLISSLQEGMPLVALEALSLGKPLITTPAGGMVDIVQNNFNGYISKNFEEESYIQCIEDYLNLSSSEKSKLSENAKRSFFNNYTIQNIANRYLELYKSALEK